MIASFKNFTSNEMLCLLVLFTYVTPNLHVSTHHTVWLFTGLKMKRWKLRKLFFVLLSLLIAMSTGTKTCFGGANDKKLAHIFIHIFA